MFVLKITPFEDTELHRLLVYLRFFLKKVKLKSGNPIDLQDKVILEYHSVQKKTEGSISLGEDGEDYTVSVTVSGGGAKEDPPLDPLTAIIERLNTKNGTEFGEHEKLSIQQIIETAITDATLQTQAQILGFRKRFMDYVVEGFEKNQDFYGKILEDDLFRSQLEEYMGEHVFDMFNKE